jgi:hypothetical protein
MHTLIRRLATLAAGAATLAGGSLLAAAPAQAGQISATISIQGAGKVDIVEGSLESGSYTCDRRTNLDERVTVTCPSVRNEELFEAWLWLRATPASSPGGHWQFIGWQGCHATRFKDGQTECAVHSGAFDGVTATPKAVFADTQPPTVSGLHANASSAYDRMFHYSFSTNEGTTSCQTDGGAWTPCTTGTTRSYATEGWHNFKVRGTDASGQVGPAQEIDVLAVDTGMSQGPSGVVGSSTATFTLTSGAGLSFRCSLDGGLFQDCAGANGLVTFTGLSQGPHTLRAYAVNGHWSDQVPYVRTWTVDTTAPETAFTSGPADGSFVLSDQAALTAVSEAGATIGCYLDAVGAACPDGQMTLSGLTRSTHVATAQATDAAGNSDPTPASRTWTVPLNNTDLTHDRWAKRTAAAAYLGTYSQATRKGATLSRKVAGARRVAVVVTRGTGFGKIGVYAGTKLLKTVDLRAASVQTKRLVPVTTFATPFTGTLKIKVATAGKVVRVEGLGVATR